MRRHRGSSLPSAFKNVSGQELIIASISTITVCISSHDNLAWPNIFLRHFFVTLTICSKSPLHHGTFSRLNFHSTPNCIRWSLTSLPRKMVCISFLRSSNVFALSERSILGSPLLGENHCRHLMKVVAIRLVTSSRSIAWVTQHVNRQIQTFSTWASLLLEIKGSSKVHCCVPEGWRLADPKWREWWWRWRSDWGSLKLPANYTLVNYRSDKTFHLNYPKLHSDLD